MALAAGSDSPPRIWRSLRAGVSLENIDQRLLRVDTADGRLIGTSGRSCSGYGGGSCAVVGLAGWRGVRLTRGCVGAGRMRHVRVACGRRGVRCGSRVRRGSSARRGIGFEKIDKRLRWINTGRAWRWRRGGLRRRIAEHAEKIDVSHGALIGGLGRRRRRGSGDGRPGRSRGPRLASRPHCGIRRRRHGG